MVDESANGIIVGLYEAIPWQGGPQRGKLVTSKDWGYGFMWSNKVLRLNMVHNNGFLTQTKDINA